MDIWLRTMACYIGSFESLFHTVKTSYSFLELYFSVLLRSVQNDTYFGLWNSIKSIIFIKSQLKTVKAVYDKKLIKI